MKKKKTHLFRFMIVCYFDEPKNKYELVASRRIGAFRASSETEAKQQGREIWKEEQHRRKFIRIVNMKGNEIVHYSSYQEK